MVVLLKLIFITFLLVMGIKIVTAEGMLLERLGKWLEKKVDEGYKFFDWFICAWCMNSWVSVVAHVFAIQLNIISFEFSWQFFIRWILVVCGASFVSGNTWNLYLTINSIKERNELQSNYYYFKNLNESSHGNQQETGKESSPKNNIEENSY